MSNQKAVSTTAMKAKRIDSVLIQLLETLDEIAAELGKDEVTLALEDWISEPVLDSVETEAQKELDGFIRDALYGEVNK